MKKNKDIRAFFTKHQIKSNVDTRTDDDRVHASGVTSDAQLVEISCPGRASFEIENNNKDDLGTPETGPSRPIVDFPKRKFGDRLRCFSSKYYNEYPWIEYSINEDKIYCFVCKNFCAKSVRIQQEKFITSGFDNWKKIGESVQKHQESQIHKESYEKHIAFKHSLVSGSIQERIITQHISETIERKEYLTKLTDIIICLARQGMSLRGHREDKFSRNKGNFLELCDLFAKYDHTFQKNLEKNTNYSSPQIQNEIISTIGTLTLAEIVNEIKQCGFFALMADEARSYKKEQLSIVLRYVNGLEVEERFIGFINCSTSRDAQSLANHVLETLKKNDLHELPIVAQSYDGASVMAGKHRGLQAIIKETHPEAIYIHCLAHRLNLVVVDACTNIPTALGFFSTIEALHTHFAQPCTNAQLKKIQESLGVKSGGEIHSLSETRWACRFENCKAVLSNYDAIKSVLEDEATNRQNKNSVEAIGLLSCIMQADFVICLLIFKSVLSTINILSKYFQSKDATLGQAINIINSTIATFERERNDTAHYEKAWEEIEIFSEANDINLEPIRVSKRRRQPSSLNDFIVDTTLGKRHDTDNMSAAGPDYWRTTIYLQILDSVINQLKNRFTNLPFAASLDNFLKLDFQKSQEFINMYKKKMHIDTDILQAEMAIVKQICRTNNLEINLKNIKQQIDKTFCSNYYKLMQVAITIPVSSADCERSFSAMRRIKSWLRASMEQDRFSNLAIINIENLLIKKNITADKVVTEFLKRNRRVIFQ